MGVFAGCVRNLLRFAHGQLARELSVRPATIDFLDVESHGRGTSMEPHALPRRQNGKLVEKGKSSSEAAGAS